MTTVKDAQAAALRIENAAHELNDAIREAGLLSVNTTLVIYDVEDQHGKRDIVFPEVRINPTNLEG